MEKILILGGSGFVGSALTQHLANKNYKVTVLDLCSYNYAFHMGNLSSFIKADIRDIVKVRDAMKGQDSVIHLSCISNDPASELNPALTRDINLTSFLPIVEAAKDAGIKRFIFASSSSVYGVKDTPDVTEDMSLEPLTDYSKYKAECEKILLDNKGNMEAVVIRPATVCGNSINLRLDLCVHILTMAALRYGKIKVFGGNQYRPNIYIDDLIDAYELLLTAENIDGEIFNCGNQNLTIMETAQMVKNIIGNHVEIEVTESNDNRSYHVSSQKIYDKLGFRAIRPIGQAILELKEAWEEGLIKNPDDAKYHRIKSTKSTFQ